MEGGDEEHGAFCTCCRDMITALLPHELLVSVFSWLSLTEMCLHVALTCRAWNSLASHQNIWQGLFAKHFSEQLEDKPLRFGLLKAINQLFWPHEFESCSKALTRNIPLHIRQRPGSVKKTVIVNMRDPITKLINKVDDVFPTSPLGCRIIFAYVGSVTDKQHNRGQSLLPEAATLAPAEQLLDLRHHYKESVIAKPARSSDPVRNANQDGSNYNVVPRLFLVERRYQRLMQRAQGQEQQDTAIPNNEIGVAVVVIENNEDRFSVRRQVNLRTRPPMVTYYVDCGKDARKTEAVGSFLIAESQGFCCPLGRQLLIDT